MCEIKGRSYCLLSAACWAFGMRSTARCIIAQKPNWASAGQHVGKSIVNQNTRPRSMLARRLDMAATAQVLITVCGGNWDCICNSPAEGGRG